MWQKLWRIYFKLEEIWFKLPEKLRFLLVGGFNTTTSFLIYYGFLFVTNGRAQLSLLLMNIININISIATMRYYVFRSHGKFWIEYQKAASSYICLYFFNVGLLQFFLGVVHFREHLSDDNILAAVPNLNKAIAQICCIVITTIITFFVHKYFSFRQKKTS